METMHCIGQDNIKITETLGLKEMDLRILEGMLFDGQTKKYSDIDLGKCLLLLHAPEGGSY